MPTMPPRPFHLLIGLALAVGSALRSNHGLAEPRCPRGGGFDGPIPLPALPPAQQAATSHLHLPLPGCERARIDLWAGGPTGVMVQIAWRGADACGPFVSASEPAPLRVGAMTNGAFVPGATYALGSVTRARVSVARCVPGGACETLAAFADGPLSQQP